MTDERRQEGGNESWRTPAAVHSRARLGWSIALFIVVLFVLPLVAKLFRWF